MKTYPTISRDVLNGMSVYAFAKLDGSNVRAEWSRKQGFYRFGSRKRLLGSDQGVLQKAEALVRQQEVEVAAVCKKNRWERAVFFYEFVGPSSFAGNHAMDEEHEVFLIDVAPHKQGILPPREFVKSCSGLKCAPLLYHGLCDGEFVEAVRAGELEGMPLEGVVCKASGSASKPIVKAMSGFLSS